MNTKSEKWLPIVGYEGRYEISNLGRVKSLLLKKPLIKKLCVGTHGYLQCTLSDDNFVQKTKKVHKLVAQAFLNHTPCGHDEHVDHIDFDKTNNKVSNLQLISSRQNNVRSVNKKSKLPTGVKQTPSGKFQAETHIKGKRIYLGTFDTEQEASKAYINAVTKGVLPKKKIPKGYHYNKKRKKYMVNFYTKKYPKFHKACDTEQEAIDAVKEYRAKHGITH